MSLIPKAFIQDVIARSDIVEVISARVTLTKRGSTHLARCPFHDEKTPSFSVSQTKQFYHCFGCGASGNVISFLTSYDRMEFPDAVEYLAAQLGLEVPREDSSQASPSKSYKELYPLMDKAKHFYQQQLRQSKLAIDYFKNRGVSGEIAKHFQLGFAPDEWDSLIKLVNNNSEDTKKLNEAGMLIEKNPGRYYDRFRNRVIFPIRDIRGRTIGFGGRSFGDEQPKYLNSPETPIFHKSQELYGLYETRQAHRDVQRVLVVEGYMDVIALFQHNINYAVATLGTAVNRQHVQKLLRYCNQLVFCFDGDTAGNNAAWKALTITLPLLNDGVHFKFLFLPKGHDPDSLIREIGTADFAELIDHAHSLDKVFFTRLQREHAPDSIEGRAHLAKSAKQYIDSMPQGIYRQLMNKRLASILDMSPDALENMQPQQTYAVEKPSIPHKRRTQMLNPAQLTIAILLQHPAMANTLGNTDFLSHTQDTDQRQLHQLILLLQQTPNASMGSILATWESPEEQQQLAELYSKPLHIEKDELESALQATLERLQMQSRKQSLDHLITQAKTRELNPSEKRQLAELLAKKA